MFFSKSLLITIFMGCLIDRLQSLPIPSFYGTSSVDQNPGDNDVVHFRSFLAQPSQVDTRFEPSGFFDKDINLKNSQDIISDANQMWENFVNEGISEGNDLDGENLLLETEFPTTDSTQVGLNNCNSQLSGTELGSSGGRSTITSPSIASGVSGNGEISSADRNKYPVTQNAGKINQMAGSEKEVGSGLAKEQSERDAKIQKDTQTRQAQEQAITNAHQQKDDDSRKAQDQEEKRRVKEEEEKRRVKEEENRKEAGEEKRKGADEEKKKEVGEEEENKKREEARQEEENKKKEEARQEEENKKKEEARQKEENKKKEEIRQEEERKAKEAEDRQAAEQANEQESRKHQDKIQAPPPGTAGDDSGNKPSKPSQSSSQLKSGDATFYGTGLGSCGKTDTDTDYICAVSKILYDSFNDMGNPNNNPVCGKKIRAHYNGNSVVVTVHDRCEACAVHDLDFSPAAFQQLGSKDEGRLHGMQWEFLS